MQSDYRVEYSTNGVPKVFEFYLFVNPLGQKCFRCEQEINKLTALISAKIDVHILCYQNQYIVSEFMRQLNLDERDLTSRNHIYRMVYLASLAYKAATMQGKKKGRAFLMRMQEQIKGRLERFSDDFVIELAEEIGLDIPTFIDDLHSDYAKHLVQKDQQIAHGMHVDITPALVIFEHRLGENGLLLEGSFSAQTILSQLDQLVEEGYQEKMKKTELPPLRLL